VGEEQREQPAPSLVDRVQAWRDDRRVVAAVCACLALAAGLAWWRAGSSQAAPPAAAPTPSAPTSNPDATTTTNPPTLIVAVVGAVRAPGVVRVVAGSRVFDVIAAAGGATADADLSVLNLAAPVDDGTRVAVPTRGQPAPEVDPGAVTGGNESRQTGGTPSGAGESGDPGELVNVNRATAAELEELPGVGPATAAAIVSDREEHGPFPTIDDLARVRGIGPAKLEQLRDLVAV
jgi:competence protein ComEA